MEQFPESRPWDHKIELKEGFQHKSFKTYNLTPEEQRELDNWIWIKGISDHLNPQWHHLSFMSRKRRKTVTLPRLLLFEQMDDQKRLPPSLDF